MSVYCVKAIRHDRHRCHGTTQHHKYTYQVCKNTSDQCGIVRSDIKRYNKVHLRYISMVYSVVSCGQNITHSNGVRSAHTQGTQRGGLSSECCSEFLYGVDAPYSELPGGVSGSGGIQTHETKERNHSLQTFKASLYNYKSMTQLIIQKRHPTELNLIK